MKISRRIRRAVLIGLGIPLLVYLITLLLAPEVGENPWSGPALLNVHGAGYTLGDVVWLSAKPGRLAVGDVVLVDWRRARAVEGDGPICALREVIAVPGDTVEIRPTATEGLTLTVGHTKIQKCYFHVAALQQSGCASVGRMTLADRQLLLLEDRVRNRLIIPARQGHIKALVCFKVGHDPIRASMLRRRNY